METQIVISRLKPAANYVSVGVLLTLPFFLTGCLEESAEDELPTSQAAPSGGSGGSSNTNQAPAISGAPPAAVTVGESYSFTPSASDPDGDALTFSIQGQPAWATFDAGNGRLSGTPQSGDEGSYSNIVISVSDGVATSSLAAFSVDVNQVSLGSITLSWTAPTQNDDGSPLTDLAGYKLYYGTSSGNYTNEITVDNPGLATYVIDNLAPDTYYVAARAFNSGGVDSQLSNEVVKQVL